MGRGPLDSLTGCVLIPAEACQAGRSPTLLLGSILILVTNTLNLVKNLVRLSTTSGPYGLVALCLVIAACASAAASESTSAPSANASPPTPAGRAGEAETVREAGTAREAETAMESGTDGVFTVAQADRGADLFDLTCGDCHASSEFSDEIFIETWGERSAYSFYRNISQTMPDDNPGSLEDQVYFDVVAYVLKINGHEAGSNELNRDTPNLRDVKMDIAASGR